MKRSLLFLITLLFLYACKEEAIDPSKRVRPVGLQITVSGSEYQLSWEGISIICYMLPCPDIADVEAEEYEIQIAADELGPFQTYRTVRADQKSINIPTAGRGGQLVARIVSKAKGAPPVSSDPVMATSGPLSQSAFYPGFGTSDLVTGGAVTPDGKTALYSVAMVQAPGQNLSPLYLAELENEQITSRKLITREGFRPAFSDDGKQVAYLSPTEKGVVIYTVATGVTRTLPAENLDQLYGLTWSPDGNWLAFPTVTEEEGRLWKMPVAGGAPVPLTPPMRFRDLNSFRQANIDWSPNGRHIAVSRTRSDGGKHVRFAISLYATDGSGEQKFFETQPGWIDTNPSFSPDGKQLAFLSSRANPSFISYSLWVRDLTTGKVRRVELLPDLIPSDDYQPQWQGNEKLIFLGTQRGKRGYFSVLL
ncbi:TolB-like translocation protein [Dyadobacter linearis]|nr:hypothetical protein [Dyadobacter sp. CECT 9623]